MRIAEDYASRSLQRQPAHPPRVDDLVHRSSNGGSLAFSRADASPEDDKLVDTITAATVEARLLVGRMPPGKNSFLFLSGQDSNTYQNLLNNGIDWKRDNARAAQFVDADSESGIVVVTGRTGTGKSTLTPKAILEAFSENQLRGVAHLLPKKIFANSMTDWYWKHADEALRSLPHI